MSSKRKRNKFDNENNQAPTRAHIVPRKNARMHIAQEMREMGDIETAESLTRRLMPRFRGRVQGLRDTHYRFPGFRTTKRRDVLGGRDGK